MLAIIVLVVAVIGLARLNRPRQIDTAPARYTGQLDAVTNAVATMEGFFAQGSTPNLPQRTNNPGNIGTYGGKIASYPDTATGFTALNSWITQHAQANPQWDFYDMFHYYLTGDTLGAGGPGQNPDAYAEFVAAQVGVDPTTPVSSVIG